MIDEHELRALVMNVRRGRFSRRAFARLLATLGITGSAAAHLLRAAGRANAQAPRPHAPSRRGGGGELRLIYWQAPVILNPHLALGVKDRDAARIFYEPLAAPTTKRAASCPCWRPRFRPAKAAAWRATA